MRAVLIALVVLAPLAQAAPPSPPTLPSPPDIVPSPVPTTPGGVSDWAFGAAQAAMGWGFASYAALHQWVFDVLDYALGALFCFLGSQSPACF